MDEHERRVAQVIGSEARDAPRGQRSFLLHDNQVLVQAGERENECLAQRKQIHYDAKTVNTCPKPIEDCKVGPGDWLVLNFKLSKDSGYVDCPNHQTTVNMRHDQTIATRMTSILELFIDRVTAYANEGNH